jgi:site-specific DNA-methyltransferase (adenine-specific)
MRRLPRLGPIPPDRAALFAPSSASFRSWAEAMATGIVTALATVGRVSDPRLLAIGVAALAVVDTAACSAPRFVATATAAVPASDNPSPTRAIADSGPSGAAVVQDGSPSATTAAPESPSPSPPAPPVTLIHGDATDVLPTLPPGSFDAVITDPPHGVLTRQAWDVLPAPAFWRNVARVLKPGAPLVAIGAPRTYHRMVVAIEDAGFLVEDVAAWIFKDGRPPSERRLKRAMAPICVARKPGPLLPLNIDDARLPYVDERDRERTRRIDSLRALGHRRGGIFHGSLDTSAKERAPFVPKAGRWPSTVITTEPLFGNADRFFMIPLLRDRNAHPAGKPVAVMAHLIRLFVPDGGTVLDPFAGGGSTGIAAAAVGRRACLIEREASFVEMARQNLAAAGVGPLVDERFAPHSAGLPTAEIMSNHEDLPITSERARVQPSKREPSFSPRDPAGPTAPSDQAVLVDQHAMAARLGVPPRAVLALARAGRIPVVQPTPRRFRFDPAAVTRALSRGGAPGNKEDLDVDPRESSRQVHGAMLSGGSPRAEASAPLQADRGDRGGEETGADLRNRGRHLGGSAQPAQAGGGQRDPTRRALDPERRAGLRRLLDIDVPAVGEERPHRGINPEGAHVEPDGTG